MDHLDFQMIEVFVCVLGAGVTEAEGGPQLPLPGGLSAHVENQLARSRTFTSEASLDPDLTPA